MSQHCDRMVDVGRRKFMSGAGLAAAGVAVTSVVPAQAKAAPAAARVDYPSNRLANVADLKVNEPLDVAYPDADAPGVLLKLGKKVPGGVGADGDIVGFSTICPHKGFPLSYNAADRTLNCPGHYSRFDCENGRPADLGPGDPEPAAVRAARRRQGRHLRRGRRRAALRPPVQRALRGGQTMAYKRKSTGCRSSRRTPRSHNVTCHFCIVGCGYNAYTLGRQQAGRHGGRPKQVRRRSLPSSRTPRPPPGTRPRCTTSSSRTARTCTSSSSPTRTAW